MQYTEAATGKMFCKKGILFCHISIMWTFVDLFYMKKLFSRETVFFQIILPEINVGSFSIAFRCSCVINKCRTSTICGIFFIQQNTSRYQATIDRYLLKFHFLQKQANTTNEYYIILGKYIDLYLHK